jgi:tetratricopeptide (TPR) repeat protein
MKALNYLEKYCFVVFAIVLFPISFAVNLSLYKPIIVISKQDEAWNLNDQMIQKFNLGFKRLESSFLWVSTILESDIEHYRKKDRNSWMFLRFKTISELEPKFYENYSFGGVYLSIIKDDLEGASNLYNTGLQIFPNDYGLLRDAGFHFYFEVGDFNRAYEIYSKLKNNPKATVQILSTLARLESSKGKLSDAFDLLLTKYNEIPDKTTFFAIKILQHLYSIKAEIDLNCLNSKIDLQKCSSHDLDNKPYSYSKGQYNASKEWSLFRIKIRKK